MSDLPLSEIYSNPYTAIASARDYLSRMPSTRFFARSISRLRPVVTRQVPSSAVTEGWVVLINPDFFMPLSRKQAATLLFHELFHVGPFKYHAEIKGMTSHESMLYNFAQDATINHWLRQIPELELPPDGLLPETFGQPENWTIQQRYEDLLSRGSNSKSGLVVDNSVGTAPMKGNCTCSLKDSQQHFEVDDITMTSSEIIQAEREIAAAIQDLKKSGQPGSTSSDLDLWAEIVLAPAKIPWQTVLSNNIRGSVNDASARGQGSESYRKPHPWQASYGYGARKPLLPGPCRLLPKVWVVIDTSGSMMSDNQLSDAYNETVEILKVLQAEITFMSNDADIKNIKTVLNPSDIKLLGGGGTDFRPPFELAAQSRKKPNVLIFITDGMGPAPESEPKEFKTIWVLCGPHKTPPCNWGAQICIE